MGRKRFDLRDAMRLLPPDGAVRDAVRKFNLSPNISGKARSVRDFAEQLGFRVERVDSLGRASGRLVRDAGARNGFRIEVNGRQSVLAQRWAVLHEIGHYFRHTDKDNPFSIDMAYDASGETFYADETEEREANEFAAAVLFGDGALAGAVGLHGRDVERLSKHFGVSRVTIEVALKQFQ